MKTSFILESRGLNEIHEVFKKFILLYSFMQLQIFLKQILETNHLLNYLMKFSTHWYVDVVLPEFCLDHICRIEAAGQVSVAVVAAVVGEAWVQDVGEVVTLRELANLYLEKSWQIVSWNDNLVKRFA